jgi:hypothetical protein
MTITVKETLLHWNYFLALESDLEDLSRYIEFSKDNFSVYSIELAHLLLASSSEVDVMAKEICEILNPKVKARNIDDYRTIITEYLPEFSSEKVFVPRYGLDFVPWLNWADGKSPIWWQGYNNVKHHRDEHFKDANLQHVLNSMGALLISVFYFYKLKFSIGQSNLLKNKDVALKLMPEADFLRLNESYYFQHLVA